MDIKIDGRWCIHSYYTISPIAGDNSGRILLSGADLDKNYGEIYILNSDGEVTDTFGRNELYPAFYHTGYWQSWSEDSRYVFYQAGLPQKPMNGVYDTVTKKEYITDGDMEGGPPKGSIIVSGLSGMLYAAGYADRKYHKELFPIESEKRDLHGLFTFDPFSGEKRLVMSINDIIEMLPDSEKQRIKDADKRVNEIYGGNEILTLMCYCVRWNKQGTRFLFYMGNHSAPNARQEEKITYIFTADKDFNNIKLALNLTGRSGCHWSWHPDGEHLVGYADVVTPGILCFAEVKYDGTGLKKIHDSNTYGHGSICPCDYNTAVTDGYGNPGRVQLLNLAENSVEKEFVVKRCNCEVEPAGRNRNRVCNHPVFVNGGKGLIVNCLEDKNSYVKYIDLS